MASLPTSGERADGGGGGVRGREHERGAQRREDGRRGEGREEAGEEGEPGEVVERLRVRRRQRERAQLRGPALVVDAGCSAGAAVAAGLFVGQLLLAHGHHHC